MNIRKNKPAVVTIGYSRCFTLEKSLERLAECFGVNEHDCYLFLDAPYRACDYEKCEKMAAVAETVRRKCIPQLKIIQRERNYGVPGNLIAAITETLKRYESVVFFEDDVLVSRTFLKYMDHALDLYRNDDRIFCINGFKSPYLTIPKQYSFDVYLNPRNMAWGFGVWANRWNKVDFGMSDWGEFSKDSTNLAKLDYAGCDIKGLIESQLKGNVHTWDVQCSYHMVKNSLYAVEPRYSLTKNIGFGENGGVHCGRTDAVLSAMKYYNFLPDLPRSLDVSATLLDRFKNSTMDFSIAGRVVRKLRRVVSLFGRCNNVPCEVKK